MPMDVIDLRNFYGRALGRVARALIGRPGLVVADEPTSALDADRQQAFIDLLLEECAASASALLFVSHDQRLAVHFDRVLDLGSLNRATAGEAVR